MPITYDLESDRPFCCGLWKAQQFVGFVLGLSLFVIFVAFGPLITEYAKANAMMGITLLCGCFWVFEVMPIYATALLPVVLIPMCEIDSTEDIAASYWRSIQMLFIAIYLVDIALEEVQLPRRLALKVLLSCKSLEPGSVLFALMSSCWFMSMFINNVAVTLMITPFVVGLIRSVEEKSRDADAAEEESDSSSSMASEALEKTSEKIQLFGEGLLLGVAYSATAGGMATLTGSIPNRLLAGVDLVSERVTWLRWFAFGCPISLVTCAVAYTVLYMRYMRRSPKGMLSKDVVEDEYKEFLAEQGNFNRDELMVGLAQLVQIILLVVDPWVITPAFETHSGSRLMSDATVAAVPALTLFLIPSVMRPGQSVLTWTAVHEKLDFGMLLLIGGGFAITRGFTQSGLEENLGAWLVGITKFQSRYITSLIVLTIGSLATQVFSSAASATTILTVLKSVSLDAVVNPMQLLLPGTISFSLAFMLPTACPGNVVVLAKSQDLPRSLRFRDFIIAGFPITVITIPIAATLGYFLGMALFQSHLPFPLEMCADPIASCAILPIAGIVQGHEVTLQACHLLDVVKNEEGNNCTTCCQLWNRTIVDIDDFPHGTVGQPLPTEARHAPVPERSSAESVDPEPEPSPTATIAEVPVSPEPVPVLTPVPVASPLLATPEPPQTIV